MHLTLDHFFILVEPEAKVADQLVSLGMREGPGNRHQGQGTSNRRFYFSNGMLEFLWVHDENEANTGPGRNLHFPQRVKSPRASPFGLVLHRKDNLSSEMPFNGWSYQPDYFAPPWAFHVGDNSENFLEPLCIYVPFMEPKTAEVKSGDGVFKFITQVKIVTPSNPLSEILTAANGADRLSIESGAEHRMEVIFDDNRCNRTLDLRPDLPLVIFW